ncbi:hypothetical protein CXF68_01245 [Tenacibaculum sp. Bg11-29]|uniref:hypothetical protein n=1 Tax=Tenacibaculum sp. Bg11-29 TaxID=2058306 RepID=UPI000C33E613|nr:hypothetical protein [Tenacibaculum sp. Bg11-29]PKH49394.1 hypothetical protein CXF68_01245 [Tenacibaculum sp. Bg11-29]
MNIDIVKKSIRKWDQIRNTELGLTFLTSGAGFEVKRKEYNSWKNVIEEEGYKSKRGNKPLPCVHLYIGVLEFETVFYLIDSISDAKLIGSNSCKNILGKTLFYKNFTKEFLEGGDEEDLSMELGSIGLRDEDGISDHCAAKRAFKWFLFSNKWAYKKINAMNKPENKHKKSEVVRVFTIPWGDFETLFNESEKNKVFLFFGLNDIKLKDEVNSNKEITFKDEIEVILCSEKGFLKKGKLPSTGNVSDSEDVTIPRPPFGFTENHAFNLLS